MPLLKNAIVDTMQISRAINTDLRQHALGVVARYYKINYDESVAHRADFDVSILYSV
jgi:DNA polymerase-3 subunit alpha (Gram-positive type)